MKRILVVSVLLAAMLLVSLAGVALAVSQKWYLWEFADGVGNYMLKDTFTVVEKSVSISDSGAAIWIADEAATVNVPFLEDTWDGKLYFTSAPTDGEDTITRRLASQMELLAISTLTGCKTSALTEAQ